jgi:hypothetical protein
VIQPVPDPVASRGASIEALQRLGLPVPPSNFAHVWEPGDGIELRPLHEIEERVAVLNVVLARCFGMPPERALAWLSLSGLADKLTEPEWNFVVDNSGDHRIFSLHLDAVFALSWVMGIAMDLDPLQHSPNGLVERLPHLLEDESYNQWRSRTLTAPRAPAEVAVVLDLYYCLDWAYVETERRQLPLPGLLDSNAIGQRRWALEWVAVFSGPHHEAPPGWEEIDLST